MQGVCGLRRSLQGPTGLGFRIQGLGGGDGMFHLLVLEQVPDVMSLEGIAHAGHAVAAGEVLHGGEDLTLPVDAIAHPAWMPWSACKAADMD